MPRLCLKLLHWWLLRVWHHAAVIDLCTYSDAARLACLWWWRSPRRHWQCHSAASRCGVCFWHACLATFEVGLCRPADVFRWHAGHKCLVLRLKWQMPAPCCTAAAAAAAAAAWVKSGMWAAAGLLSCSRECVACCLKPITQIECSDRLWPGATESCAAE
ncbi:hypothetical protein COO60DRAFT_575684 [Scenedesmus sp. NREL 46B-D3]|nr:hypothetical protein COO60DRAFT_575684 [Scenedesmus sp. NREL 46B-D3]